MVYSKGCVYNKITKL